MSERRKRELVTYRRLKREHMAVNPLCVVCGKPASDIHHKKPVGRGGGFLDPDNFLSVCREHHRQIHDNPKWAEANNLLTV